MRSSEEQWRRREVADLWIYFEPFELTGFSDN
jgi:hypothetical protein